MHGQLCPVLGRAYHGILGSVPIRPTLFVRCSASLHTYHFTADHPRSFASSTHRLASLTDSSTRITTVAGMAARRSHSTQVKETQHKENPDDKHEHAHKHDHDHHAHSHSHSVYGSLTHSHSNGDEGHSHGVEALKSAGTPNPLFSNTDLNHGVLRWNIGDKGSRVTLIGLGANVVLTTSKGLAGWFMVSELIRSIFCIHLILSSVFQNSASLLADAGHSLSGMHII
jgi:hypothetical protein